MSAREVPSTPQAQLVLGGPATGKTQALVERCASLANEGVPAGEILVLCATPDAAERFSARLAAACPRAGSVRVRVPRALFLEALSSPSARAFTGRDSRLLAPFERDFLFEDLKTTGERPRRLREMTRFFFRGMSELADWDPGWLVNDEERSAFSLMKECLAFERGIAEPELANLFCSWALARPGAASSFGAAHVLVDDYQLLSRASQVAANLLARDSIAVAADEGGCAEVFESHPYVAGIDEFRQANPSARVVELHSSHACQAASGASHALRAYAEGATREPGAARRDTPHGTAKASPCAHAEIYADPAREISAAAETVAAWVDAGARPGEIHVACCHPQWEANLARALGARGIPVERALDTRRLRGDIRDLDSCAEARALTALYLVADPHDGVAWRSWCGFGDWLGASSAFSKLRERALHEGQTIEEALELVASRPDARDERISHLAETVHATRALRESCRDLSGHALLETICAQVLGDDVAVPPIMEQLTSAFPNDSRAGDDARAMAARARRRLALPRFERDDCVHVGPLAGTCGSTPGYLLVCGLVNGLFPAHACLDPTEMDERKASRVLAADARLLSSAAGKPTRGLFLTSFQETTLVAAERLHLKIHRVRLREGERRALVEPSLFIDYMGT